MKAHKAKLRRHHYNHTVKKSKSTANPSIILLILVALLVLILSLVAMGKVDLTRLLSYTMPQEEEETMEEIVATPSISPTPYPITKGNYTYTFTWGSGTTIPKMTTLTVEPHDPAVGQTQTVKVQFTHTAPIDSVKLMLKTDTKESTFPMTLIEGINTDGTWTGSWTIPETHDYTYILTPVVTSGGKEIPYKTVIRELP